MLRRSFAVALAAVLLLPACPGFLDDTPPASEKASWTVMVYLLADNDLEGPGLVDLEEMMRVGSNENVTIVAQVDRALGEAEGAVGGLTDWSGAKRIRVQKGSLEEIEDLGAVNMGEPATLADFIGWAAEFAPADRYALVLWDHGGAWPQYGVDFSANNAGLDLKQLKTGISSGLKKGGLARFDLIGFDACLMATYETALALRSFGDYLLASEETEPGHGWDYANLQYLASTPSATGLDLGKRLIQGYYAQAQQENDADVVTLSLVDLGQMGAVQTAVDAFATALSAEGIAAKAGQQRSKTVEFAKNPRDPSKSTHMIDLAHFATNMAAADGSLGASAQGVKDAIAKAVRDNITGSAYRRAAGISIYFPPIRAWYNTLYDQVDDVAGWRGFLKAYFQSGASGAAPEFSNPNHLGELQADGESLTLTGQLTAGTYDNVVALNLEFGVRTESGKLILIGDQPGTLGVDGVASGTWDVSVLVVQQGSTADYAYLSAEVSEAGTLLTVPFVYKATASDEQFVVLQILLDGAGNERSRTFYAQNGDAWGELTPVAGSTMHTLLQIAGEGWAFDSSTTFDPRQSLELGFQALAAGEKIEMYLTATDIVGQSDYVKNGVTL